MNSLPAPLPMLVLGFLLLVTVSLGACSGSHNSAGQTWLHGTWILTFNPERDSRDDLVFREDGSVAIHTEDNRIIDGQYRVHDDELLMALHVNDQVIDVSFEISEDKSRLTYRNGAFYEKRGATTPAP